MLFKVTSNCYYWYFIHACHKFLTRRSPRLCFGTRWWFIPWHSRRWCWCRVLTAPVHIPILAWTIWCITVHITFRSQLGGWKWHCAAPPVAAGCQSFLFQPLLLHSLFLYLLFAFTSLFCLTIQNLLLLPTTLQCYNVTACSAWRSKTSFCFLQCYNQIPRFKNLTLRILKLCWLDRTNIYRISGAAQLRQSNAELECSTGGDNLIAL
jgi:hypothetical protein